MVWKAGLGGAAGINQGLGNYPGVGRGELGGGVRLEARGGVALEAGVRWTQSPRIRHNVMYYSDDYDVLEITMPAVYDTVAVKD